MEKYSVFDCSIIELDKHHSDRKGNLTVVQNGGSATTDNALQSEPNADDGSTSNGTASNVSNGKGKGNSSSAQEQIKKVAKDQTPNANSMPILRRQHCQ